ncbi:MAG TPA: chemotaxis protein CheW [Burkholderiaceae bacterium]|nr:chemotaxis protein CheW [Burkholderiaceae bacterium]
MSKRQSLRDLQSRLAEKLEAAKSGAGGTAASWLAVDANGSKFLFPLSQSGEIYPLTPTHQVAHTKDWFIGVANLRGALFGIADFDGFLKNTKPVPRPVQKLSDVRFVTLSAAIEMNCALQVDKLDGLRGMSSFKKSEPPTATSPAYFGHVYTDLNDAKWQEINLQILAQQDEFLNINKL